MTKKILSYVLALALVCASSCNKEQAATQPPADCIKVKLLANACDGVAALQLVDPQDFHLGTTWTYRGQIHQNVFGVKNYCDFIAWMRQRYHGQDIEGREFYIRIREEGVDLMDCYVCAEYVPHPGKRWFVEGCELEIAQ